MTGELVREILAVGSSRAVPDFLQSIFVAELLCPSRRLWLVSPEVHDIPILDNTARQFNTVCSEFPAGEVRLSAVLGAMMERGTQVILIAGSSAGNEALIASLRALPAATPQLTVIRTPLLHHCGILGDRFALDGSMHLTHDGVFLNDERLWYRCDAATVEQRRLELENRWRAELCS